MKKDVKINYTPEPWTIAESKNTNSLASDRWLIQCQSQFPDIKTTLATCGFLPHARLLAAAPELLASLEYALAFLESLPKGWLSKTSGDIGALNDFYLTAPKAIAKAKGGAA